jgi:hypothetical protein
VESYAITALAAAGPNQVVLYEVAGDRFRMEPIALHVLVEHRATSWDRRTDEHPYGAIRRLLLPVPLSVYGAGFDCGELAYRLSDRFWECRVADVDSTLARLADLYPCGPGCGWTTEETTDDGTARDFLLLHGPDCEEHGEPMNELESAA